MQGFIKTLFGDKYTLIVAACSGVVAFAVLQSPAAILAGVILPICLLVGVAYLARR